MMRKTIGKAKPSKGRLKASFVISLSDVAPCHADCHSSVTNLTGLIWPCIIVSRGRTERMRGGDADRWANMKQRQWQRDNNTED